MKTEAELKECAKEAYSLENMAGHGAEHRKIEEIGFLNIGHGKYIKLYQDNEGDYWYKTYFGTKDGVIPEYDAIFGKKKSRHRNAGRP